MSAVATEACCVVHVHMCNCKLRINILEKNQRPRVGSHTLDTYPGGPNFHPSHYTISRSPDDANFQFPIRH